MPPRNVGPYEVLSVIGRGGVATVCRARDRRTMQLVAVKLVGPPPACDPRAARRLAREFEALQGLDHPNVVRVYDAGVAEGYSFLAMELVQGLDLRSYLSPALDKLDDTQRAGAGRAGGSISPVSVALIADLDPWSWSDEPHTEGLPDSIDLGPTGSAAIRAFAAMMEEPETNPSPGPARAHLDDDTTASCGADAFPVPDAVLDRLNHPGRLARLRAAVMQVCDALAYVHARGLVHRDLKPSNIMVDDARRVRVMDFGLVRLPTEPGGHAEHGSVVGTYRYMAPEQARGEPLDHRADLYSLGVILFELACGRPPFVERRPNDLWQAIVSRPAPAPVNVNPRVDARLAHVVERLLAKHPQERFQSAADVASALREPSAPRQARDEGRRQAPDERTRG